MEFPGRLNCLLFLKLYRLNMSSSKSLGIKMVMNLNIAPSHPAADIPIVLETPASF
jgi:hypothetical protein